MSKRLLGVVSIAVAVIGGSVSSAAAADYAATAYNIVPSGQYGGLPIDPAADDQALMYDGLTPLFDQVSDGDIDTFFKSAMFGVGPDGPAETEPVPRPGVQILRDSYNVPHVYTDNPEDGIWAAGWLLAEDRGLLLNQARYNARVAAVDVPNVTAIGLIRDLQNFQPSERTEAVVAKQTKVLKKAGKQGKRVLADIDTFISGINAYLQANSPSTEPWTRNDVYAVNALKGQFLGQGGGDEARRSQFLSGLQDRLGSERGMSVFNDLRQFRNKEAPTSIDGKFAYGRIPAEAPGSVALDPGSFERVEPVAGRRLAERYDEPQAQASNTLQINAERSATGNPLMVGGPQIGYFYPGFTYEMDMHAGKLQWRGVTSAPFPGYMLIGRGADFAVTLTSASGDILDQYAEELCGGSDTKYMYKGKCRSMIEFDAGTLGGEPVVFNKTVHGSVVGYGTVDGERVAIAQKRSSYGKDVLDQLFFRRLSTGAVKSPESFFRAANKTPQTFNSFYMDNEHNAMFTSGLLPKRPKGTDPGLLTRGTGEWEWEGFLAKKRHPQGIDPKDGTLTNWNNNVVRGFGVADSEWGRAGSAARVDLLDYNLERLQSDDGTWTLAAVTSAMNASATQDVRAIDTVPLLARVLKGSEPPNQQALQMLEVMQDWRREGGSRLDVDLDGEIDHPGAAVMDGAWSKLADAFMRPQIGTQLDELDDLFSRFDLPPGGQYSGWYQYFDRDIRALLGKKVKAPLDNAYCGKGDLERCQADLWAAMAEAGAEIEAEQGSPQPATWRSDAERERISFAPGLLPTTLRYTNRPSGIQQVISFDGHR